MADSAAKLLMLLGSVVCCALLMGMDPEYEPVDIEPPEPEKKAGSARDLGPPDEPILNLPEPTLLLGSRLPFGLDGPFRLDLDLRFPLDDLSAEPAGPAEPGEAERVGRVLDRMVRGFKARERVVSGQVHPAFEGLGREAEERWQPEVAQIRDPERTEPSLSWVGGTFWQRLLDSPPSAGDSFGHYSGKAEEAFLDPEQWLPKPAPPVPYEERVRNATLRPPRFERVTALVEVRFDLDGLPKLRLTASSGYALYDQAALEALAAAIRTSPLERPDGAAVAVYAATSDIRIKSVLPVSGLGLDLVLPLLDPVIPAKTSLQSNIELLTVEPVD